MLRLNWAVCRYKLDLDVGRGPLVEPAARLFDDIYSLFGMTNLPWE